MPMHIHTKNVINVAVLWYFIF